MHRLVSTALALMLTGTALGQGSTANRTLTCSAAFPSVAVACFIEQPVYAVGPLEVAIGVDARAVVNPSSVTLGAYGVLAWYTPEWNAWLEVAIPELVPPIGRQDPLRLGFTVRF